MIFQCKFQIDAIRYYDVIYRIVTMNSILRRTRIARILSDIGRIGYFSSIQNISVKHESNSVYHIDHYHHHRLQLNGYLETIFNQRIYVGCIRWSLQLKCAILQLRNCLLSEHISYQIRHFPPMKCAIYELTKLSRLHFSPHKMCTTLLSSVLCLLEERRVQCASYIVHVR